MSSLGVTGQTFRWEKGGHILNISGTFSIPVFLLTAVLAALIIHLVKLSRRNLKVHTSIPRVPSFPFLGPVFQFIKYKNDIPKLVELWAQKYPKLAKLTFLGKHVVLINSPAMIQKLHFSNDTGHLEKPADIFPKIFVGSSGKGLFCSKTDQWTPHRKVLSRAFTHESLKSYVPIFNRHAKNLVAEVISDDKVSLSTIIKKFCLDIIFEIVMGKNLSAVLTRQDIHNFHQDLMQVREIITYRFSHPWLLSDSIWSLHPYKRKLNCSVERLEELFKEVRKCRSFKIPDSSISSGRAKCMLDLMLSENWREDEIIAEVATMLLGGHETISSALHFLLFLLATEPSHQRACQEEIDNLFDNLEQNGEDFSIQSVNQLKYLERCVKETLRLFPTVPLTWRELGAPLYLGDGVIIESGTLVVYAPWAIHRNPEYFPNPSKFDPDRFLPENCASRRTHTFLPFSAGARNCIGWKMAMLEITVLAAVILRHLDVSTRTKLEDIKINFSFTIWPSEEPHVALKRRCK